MIKILLLIYSLTLGVWCDSNKYEKCFYYGQKEKSSSIKEEDNCITFSSENIPFILKDNDAFIATSVIHDAYYNKNNLGELYSKVGSIFFTKQGRARRILKYDNAADNFQNGLARIVDKNHKVGYCDSNLTIIIQPKYDFAYPFEKNVAIVCNGCEKVQLHEHTWYTQGRWGAINNHGEIIHPLIYASFGEINAVLKSVHAEDIKDLQLE